MKEIQKNIKEKQYHKAYLISGSQSYSIMRAKQELISSIFPDDTFANIDENINYVKYSQQSVDINEIKTTSHTFPFFSTKRVIELNHTGIIKSNGEELINIIESMPDTSCIVIIETETDKRSKAYKWIKNNQYATEFNIPPANGKNESDMIKTVAAFIARAGKSIKESDARLLLNRTGYEIFNIKNEIDKLVSYLGERINVETSDIEAVILKDPEDHVFDMVEAIASKDRKKAMDCYNQLLMLKESAARTIILLYRQYKNLLIIKSMLENGISDEEISKETGIRTYYLKKHYARLGRYSLNQLINMADLCLAKDMCFKSGKISDQLACETLICELLET